MLNDLFCFVIIVELILLMREVLGTLSKLCLRVKEVVSYSFSLAQTVAM